MVMVNRGVDAARCPAQAAQLHQSAFHGFHWLNLVSTPCLVLLRSCQSDLLCLAAAQFLGVPLAFSPDIDGGKSLKGVLCMPSSAPKSPLCTHVQLEKRQHAVDGSLCHSH